jgi:hypothetical protein
VPCISDWCAEYDYHPPVDPLGARRSGRRARGRRGRYRRLKERVSASPPRTRAPLRRRPREGADSRVEPDSSVTVVACNSRWRQSGATRTSTGAPERGVRDGDLHRAEDERRECAYQRRNRALLEVGEGEEIDPACVDALPCGRSRSSSLMKVSMPQSVWSITIQCEIAGERKASSVTTPPALRITARVAFLEPNELRRVEPGVHAHDDEPPRGWHRQLALIEARDVLTDGVRPHPARRSGRLLGPFQGLLLDG